ncbi:MAG TPA: hypothetical protein VMF90_06300, partial [Rhizobiaceae bacterium]|nr:hypothetical protein [Rhizobiaceae bacterium]
VNLSASEEDEGLGWTEHINQSIAMKVEDIPFLDPEGEPELGWTGHGRGCTKDEPRDDREGDDERDNNLAGVGTDLEADEAYYDGPGTIGGGHDGFFPTHAHGMTPRPQVSRPSFGCREQARKLPDGSVIRTVLFDEDAPVVRRPAHDDDEGDVPLYFWNASGRGSLPPEAFEDGMLPEIDPMRAIWRTLN